MLINYFISFYKSNKLKIIILILNIAIYFTLAVVLASLNKTLPELASLPFKKIGISTIVQKTGQLPSQMTGAIFPHSNGPIYQNEVLKLSQLDFVQNSDIGLYFWYFDDQYFKTSLGIKDTDSSFSNLLKQNLEQGDFKLANKTVLITNDFAKKNDLSLGQEINFGNNVFIINGILKANLSGNIIPADIYMNLSEAQNIALESEEMQRIYKFENKDFVNIVALDTDPKWQGNKEKLINSMDNSYITFSEKTFTKEVLEQIKLVSTLGKTMFAILGLISLIVFSLLVFYNFKTREREIAVLRMIGWGFKDLQKQFIGESTIILALALAFGNLLGILSLIFLRQQKISMELPWEVSAKPHFLVEENAINRTITANLPIHFDPWLFIWLSLAFFVIFGIVNYISFQRLKNIKPANYLK